MSSAPPLLPQSAAGAGQPSRAASAVVAKPAWGFQLFRIDGYSWTKTLPGGECISSELFTVGGRTWQVDYYPNGTDSSKQDSDSISLYLRLQHGGYHGRYKPNERVRAQFRFSLLDLSGNAAYELPAETGIFTLPNVNHIHGRSATVDGEETAAELGCGNADFITGEELERRRESLLREDSLAIRCDVGVMELETLSVGAKQKRKGPGHGGYSSFDDAGDDADGDGSRDGGRRQKPQDDREFIRRCLTSQRRRH